MSFPSSHQNQTPRRIRQLPVQLANQIAAGEVIERPASVVKELVENSIDANPSQIDIIIERGGIQLIQVNDNGHGIVEEDLALALNPHATSKVYTLAELNQIRSLGFRGEALASIASISHITLQSRQLESPMGWMVTGSELESNQEPQPCAIPSGSRIAVRELFFNTPGRKRFLRTERTEFLQIEAMVRRMALSHFEIGFLLEHNGKTIFRLPAASNDEQRLQRIGQLFGRSFADAAMQIRFEAGGMVLSGWIAPPGYSISQSDRQYFYLNGRGMRDKVISHAIRHVYQDVITEGRHPAYLLNLEIDPEQVDVNVHPTKHEVRFRQGRMVHDFLATSLLRAFEERGVASVDLSAIDRQTGELYPAHHSNHSHDEHSVRVAESGVNYPTGATEKQLGETLFRGVGKSELTLIAQRYLLFISSGEHYLCDLHSLYQRVVDEAFERLSSGVVQQLEHQPLLFPERINYVPELPDDVVEGLAQLSPFGIEVDLQNGETLLLRTLPTLLNGSDAQKFMTALIKQWSSEELPLLLCRLVKEYGVVAASDPAEYEEPSSSWLKRFFLHRLAELIEARETLRLDSKALAKLFE